jgi:hypothetical protein
VNSSKYRSLILLLLLTDLITLIVENDPKTYFNTDRYRTKKAGSATYINVVEKVQPIEASSLEIDICVRNLV